MPEPTALRILVVNGKGGCGKTTIATNLAAAYAHRGYAVALSDYDAQASSSQWHEQRPAQLSDIRLIASHQRTAMYTTRSYQLRVPPETQRIVIDTPSAVGDRDLDTLLRGVHAVLVPVLPSSIDIRAGTRFIAQLLLHRSYRARRPPVGVIANRVRENTHSHAKLMQFLRSLNIPTVATFGDCSLYTRLAEQGTGIFEDELGAAMARETREWNNLLRWIDSAAERGCQQPMPPRAAATLRAQEPHTATEAHREAHPAGI